MKHPKSHSLPLVAALGALLMAPSLLAAPAQSDAAKVVAKSAPTSNVVAGVILLKRSQDLSVIAQRTGIKLEKIRDLALGWEMVSVPGDIEQTQKHISTLKQDIGIVSASEERRYQKFAAPSDPLYSQMWHLQSIGMEEAWESTTGLSTQRVGVVDTGSLRQHEELSSKDIAGYDFISSSEAGGDGNGRDADYNDSGDGADCGFGFQPSSYHGSHVAGTILGATNNGTGIAGINWNAGLVTARALGKCGGDLSDIMEGAAWLAGAEVPGVPSLAVEDRVSVMNLSLGGFGACSAYEQQVIDFVNEQGVLFVAASGNDGGVVNSPANCDDVITVAAHGIYSSLTDYSSFDISVEIVAPGGETLNAQNQAVLSLTGPGNDEYEWNQGTSMAAPHVAGAISILQAVNPDITLEEVIDLMNETGGACAGCSGKRALRLDRALTVLQGGTVEELGEHSSPETALPIECGTTVTRGITPGQETYFVIDGEGGRSVDVELNALGDFDLDLYVSRTDGTEITSSTSPTGQESVSLLVNQTTYLQIVPFEDARGDYTINIECLDVTDDFEPNSTIEEAALLECNTSADLYMFPDDRDWFLLDVNEGELFDLNLVADGEFDLDVYVTTSRSRRDIIAEGTSPSGNELVTDVVGLAQPVYAVVIPFDDATGAYRMALSCPERPIEPEVPDLPDDETPDSETPDDETPDEGAGQSLSDDAEDATCAHLSVDSVGVPGATLALLAMIGLLRRRRDML